VPSKSAILEPLGLITRPNQLGQYADGACAVAHGVLANAPGSVESAPAFEAYVSINCGDPVLRAEVIRTTGKTLVLVQTTAGWRYCWVSSDGTPSPVVAASNAYDSDVDFAIDGRVDWMITRDRVFVTSTTGVMVFDYLDPTTDQERAPRLAGLAPPAFYVTPDTSSGASAIKDGNHAHVVAVLTRHFPDCYEVTSPPSAAVQVRASGSALNIGYNALNRSGDPAMQPGDTIEMYRTIQSTAPKNPGPTPDDYDPGTSTGSDYYLSSTFEIPTSGGYGWTEATGDQNLGESLYTNAGAIGASAQKRPPPICRAMATYRNYSFYFDVTEPVARVARAGAGVGELTDEYSRRYGIGTRTITCTYSSASPTLTGISAADMIGMVVGLEVTMPDFSKRTVSAVGTTTLTLSAAAGFSGTGQLETNDVIEISGTKWSLENADAFAFIYGANFDDLARVNPDTPGTKTTPATGFAPRYDWAGRGDMTLRATHGSNYLPALPEITATAEDVERPHRTSGMGWTESGQPEALTQYGIVGTGTVYAACATSICMVMFSSQGIHRLAGTGGSSSAGFDWSQDQIDSSVSLTGPKALCRLADDVYALTNVGAVIVTAGGQVQELSTSALGTIGGAPWSSTSNARVIAEEGSGDVYFMPDPSTGTAYVYSTRWNKWTTVTIASSVLCASSSLQTGLTFGRANGTALEVLRKSTTSYQASLVRFQPLFQGDPLNAKRWQEAEWLFGGGAEGVAVTLLVNEMTGLTRTLTMPRGATTPTHVQPGVPSGVQGTPSTFALAMVSQEIPRNAPAVSYSISLGYSVAAGTTKVTFCGLGVSAAPIASIRRKR
jgi:hypothetical protein